jgi:hypothetical protein
MTLVRQAEAWYSERRETLSKLFLRTQTSSTTDPDDPNGQFGLGIEASNVIANISIWNSGRVRIPALNKVTGADFALDDRALAPDEDLGVLLDRYVEQIRSGAGSPLR